MNIGKCELLKKHECPGVYCIHFISPCPTCSHLVRDCSRCILFHDPEKQPAKARQNIKEVLKPTECLADPGPHGAYAVIDDGSLLGGGGVEVTTVGRRVDYGAFFDQAKKISDECIKHGAYLNERTSIHMHLVAGYFDISTRNGTISIKYNKRGRGVSKSNSIKELEKPMPEIILANFHQLLRRYHNALTWMTSSGTDMQNLTRWIKFRKSILKYSTLRTNMSRVIEQIANDIDSGGKYAFLSYYNTKFQTGNLVNKFHVEGRYCDGMVSPTAVASMGILLYALLMKAVSISQYGILHSGDSEYMKLAYEIQSVLLNNDGSYQGPRTSDTSRFEPYMETVRKQSLEMVTLLHNELKIHGPALGVLQKLAETPCSLRLIRGDTWDKIETDLSGRERKNTDTENKILKAIDTFYIDDCINENEWLQTLSEDTGIDIKTTKKTAKELAQTHVIMWDVIVGTYVRC